VIKGLYETHLFVESLVRSINFYKNVLGLQQCYYEEERRAAFFWISTPKQAMLGLWEKPKEEIDIRYFAFSCDADDILNNSVSFLKERNVKPYKKIRHYLNPVLYCLLLHATIVTKQQAMDLML